MLDYYDGPLTFSFPFFFGGGRVEDSNGQCKNCKIFQPLPPQESSVSTLFMTADYIKLSHMGV